MPCLISLRFILRLVAVIKVAMQFRVLQMLFLRMIMIIMWMFPIQLAKNCHSYDGIAPPSILWPSQLEWGPFRMMKVVTMVVIATAWTFS